MRLVRRCFYAMADISIDYIALMSGMREGLVHPTPPPLAYFAGGEGKDGKDWKRSIVSVGVDAAFTQEANKRCTAFLITIPNEYRSIRGKRTDGENLPFGQDPEVFSSAFGSEPNRFHSEIHQNSPIFF
ncbi:hypothetical protein CEXT_699391 [Caerostris extrusa]|uniref:Uncharacterized protein n=1 Tax=Caerostris extrusa TaxID=172846 RepID=A0AAV4W7W9_CAEEX|nr:hypothetical protein CEXT_699391 [Caerostris extrusa]